MTLVAKEFWAVRVPCASRSLCAKPVPTWMKLRGAGVAECATRPGPAAPAVPSEQPCANRGRDFVVRLILSVKAQLVASSGNVQSEPMRPLYFLKPLDNCEDARARSLEIHNLQPLPKLDPRLPCLTKAGEADSLRGPFKRGRSGIELRCRRICGIDWRGNAGNSNPAPA